jgi:hypothetical protein
VGPRGDLDEREKLKSARSQLLYRLHFKSFANRISSRSHAKQQQIIGLSVIIILEGFGRQHSWLI